MLLPQSSAFVSLRNRLNAVNSSGFLHIAPKTCVLSSIICQLKTKTVFFSLFRTTFSGRSKIGGRPDDIKWQDLLTHFRTVQVRHEKFRRGEESSAAAFALSERPDKPSLNGTGQAPLGRPGNRRRVTGTEGFPSGASSGATSPGPSAGTGTVEQTQMRERSRTGGILSPLNPRRGPGALLGFTGGAAARPKSPSLQTAQQNKHRRLPGLGKG